MKKWYFLTGVIVASAAMWTYKNRQRKLKATRSTPDGTSNEDMNRGRLGDATLYDRVTQVSLL